jgi:hypothetical protein
MDDVENAFNDFQQELGKKGGLPALVVEVLSAKCNFERVKETGFAPVEMIIRAKNTSAKKISRIKFNVAICSSRGDVIGQYYYDDYFSTIPAGEELEHESIVETFGYDAKPIDELRNATIYVSVRTEAFLSTIDFEPTILSHEPITLRPINPGALADGVKLVRATAFVNAFHDFRGDGGEVNLYCLLMNTHVSNFASAEITFMVADESSTHEIVELPPQTLVVLKPGANFDKKRFKNIEGKEIKAELHYYETFVGGCCKHHGIEIEPIPDEAIEEEKSKGSKKRKTK